MRRTYQSSNYSHNNNNNNNNNNKEACLTMHQPWASLLVFGIKRIEGRSWPSPLTGRLWIHAASKVPDAQTIRAMEEFYREIYALDGVTDLKFPDQYPVSQLVGCVEIVGCLRREELASWKLVPRGVRLEALTNFCWLCEHPMKLSVPLKMRGDQGVYNLESKITEAAISSLVPVESPLPMKFPLPNPGDRYSLRPGSLHFDKSDTQQSEPEHPPSLIAAIAGAQAAAMQYTKKNHSSSTDTFLRKDKMQTKSPYNLSGMSMELKRTMDTKTINNTGRTNRLVYVEKQKQPGSNSSDRLDKRPAGPSQILSSALKGIKPA